MNAPDPQHLRINERLKAYWENLCKARPMPLESDVVIEDLKDIWDWCFLVSYRDNKFSYSYLGKELIDAYGDDITGKEITETLLYPHPVSLLSTFRQVIQSKTPGVDESEFNNSRGSAIKYRSCVMPLGAHGHDSTAFLLGGMKWKAY
ncbi:MAG: PAS domain-containing protein [Rickettsiales bacterium]